MGELIVKLSEIQKDNSKVNKIQVLSYLPITKKMLMIQGSEEIDGIKEITGIVDDCIGYKNGMYYIDHIKKEVSFVFNMVINYTDLQLDEIELEDGSTLYDFIITSGIWEYVNEKIPKEEYFKISDLMYETLEQELKIRNSFEGVISRNLSDLIDKMPTDKQLKSIGKSLIKDLNKLDLDKVPMLKKMWETANGK